LAGVFTTWAGGFTTWAGGFTTWAGSDGNGRFPALNIQGQEPLPWAGRYSLEFLEDYSTGEPAPVTAPIGIQEWVEEYDWDSPNVYMPMVSGN
jgi:hypothetical protein